MCDQNLEVLEAPADRLELLAKLQRKRQELDRLLAESTAGNTDA